MLLSTVKFAGQSLGMTVIRFCAILSLWLSVTFHFSVFQEMYVYRKREHDDRTLFAGTKQAKSQQTRVVITRPLTQSLEKKTSKYRSVICVLLPCVHVRECGGEHT